MTLGWYKSGLNAMLNSFSLREPAVLAAFFNTDSVKFSSSATAAARKNKRKYINMNGLLSVHPPSASYIWTGPDDPFGLVFD